VSAQDAVFVRVTDWEGLYIDGRLVEQNSTMDLAWELDGKSVNFRFREGTEEEDRYIMETGGFPTTLEELVSTNR